MDRTGKETETTETTGVIPAQVLTKIAFEEKRMQEINIWCEIQVKENGEYQYLRAHPHLDKFGPFYDWVAVEFEVEDSAESMVSPAKLLAFYTNEWDEKCAIIHSANWSTGKETLLGNTRIVSNNYLEFQSSGWPSLRKIKVADIDRPLLAYESKPRIDPLPPKTLAVSSQKEYIVTVVAARIDWAHKFYEWAKNEVVPMMGLNTRNEAGSSDESSVDM